MGSQSFPNVGLIGKMRAGKDIAASYLAEKYGYTRFAFGDSLKDDFHRRYPEIPRNPKPRLGYQYHGQLLREHIDEDIWIKRCLAKIDDFQIELRSYWSEMDGCMPEFPAVITDVRQLNEASALKSAGYVLIRVEAPESLRIQRAIESGDTFNLRDLTHDTETQLDGFTADYTVQNSGTLGELYRQLDEVVAKVGRAA